MVEKDWALGGCATTRVLVDFLALAIAKCDNVPQKDWIELLESRVWDMNQSIMDSQNDNY
jgi:hypothetical protein